MSLPTRILIAEDERIAAEDVRRRLESWGYQVQAVVSSGEDAILKAEELQPDLMLMDIHLAGEIDGIEAARQIREQTGIPVVYATACSDTATRERAALTEPSGFISKPFDDVEMRSTIEVALLRRQMEHRPHETSEVNVLDADCLEEAIIAIDSRGCVRFVNPRASLLLQKPPLTLLGKHLSEVVHVQERASFEPLLAGLLGLRRETSLRASPVRVNLIQRNGNPIPISLHSSHLRDPHGGFSGTLLCLHNTPETVQTSLVTENS